MLKAFVGYLTGAVSAFWFLGGLVKGSVALAIIPVVLVFGLLMMFTHKYHIKKRKEYYDKLKGK